ncbi:hypothetical protein E4582_06675 [Luteimonas yindakuii]|uniref:Uncharacterized protein n=1 Tax=Luteimonas yindakuii TaxID=2565782 RepID=A0A4Z1RE76_9GAMM|nr:hypothetical protein E5843_14570 [Luteimonas yindakuii]TKS54473.1 hypothetical protein E4582_06675 [Luteimonas yindakuii]
MSSHSAGLPSRCRRTRPRSPSARSHSNRLRWLAASTAGCRRAATLPTADSGSATTAVAGIAGAGTASGVTGSGTASVARAGAGMGAGGGSGAGGDGASTAPEVVAAGVPIPSTFDTCGTGADAVPARVGGTDSASAARSTPPCVATSRNMPIIATVSNGRPRRKSACVRGAEVSPMTCLPAACRRSQPIGPYMLSMSITT